MPTLVIDDIPVQVFDRLQRRAEVLDHSIGEEAITLLERGLQQEDVSASLRLPDLIEGKEISAPVDLPRPGPAVEVPYIPGKPRLPDPMM